MYSLYRRHLSERTNTRSTTSTPTGAATITWAAPSTVSAAVDSASTHVVREGQQAAPPAITITAVSSDKPNPAATTLPLPASSASSPPLSTVQILLSRREAGGEGEDSISCWGGIRSPPAVSPAPLTHTQLALSAMGKPRPLPSASHKQTVFDETGVFTIIRSPSVVSQQPSRTVLPHQYQHDEHHSELHHNNNNNNDGLGKIPARPRFEFPRR
ncbi:hypothetical protein GWK47_008737 [Chionoecetes opilio]|uniref:Uncharacterized protein n=1 Tax=Chionoecetes opilio TaxID=41210 RepID=A0A8J4Y3I4_CHIOP|nr:hypothetical protein GWK47_008737 [Chionoecetes opilio]